MANALLRPFQPARRPAADAGGRVVGSRWRTLQGPLLLALVAGAYLALAQLVIWLNDPVKFGAGFWPAAGLSLGLLLLLDRSRWPWVLTGVAIAEVAGDLAHGYREQAIVLWTIGNVVEPLV